MPRKKPVEATDTAIPNEENTEMTSTETETETETAATDGPQVMVGVAAPKRTRNGSGRSRQDNPFDAIMEDLYASGEWAGVPFSGEEQEQKFRNQLKNAAQNAGYGLDMGTDVNEPGVLKFHIRDKVEGRGRKAGSRKIDGKFYSPDELDADGNPTPEARAAKESAE